MIIQYILPMTLVDVIDRR